MNATDYYKNLFPEIHFIDALSPGDQSQIMRNDLLADFKDDTNMTTDIDESRLLSSKQFNAFTGGATNEGHKRGP